MDNRAFCFIIHIKWILSEQDFQIDAALRQHFKIIYGPGSWFGDKA